jgi:hypothetical protein
MLSMVVLLEVLGCSTGALAAAGVSDRVLWTSGSDCGSDLPKEQNITRGSVDGKGLRLVMLLV